MKILQRTIKYLFGATLLILTLMLMFEFVFDIDASFLQKVKVDNAPICYYKFDLHGYLVNLKEQSNSLKFTLIIPNLPTIPELNFGDLVTVGLTLLAKALFFVINWAIFIIDMIFILSIKLIAYIFLFFFALLGVNTGNLRNIFAQLYAFNIPYMDYSWVTITLS